MVLGEARKKVKKVKIGFTEETLKEAKELANKLAEGNLSVRYVTWFMKSTKRFSAHHNIVVTSNDW